MMSNQHQMERLTNATLGDKEHVPGGGGNRASASGGSENAGGGGDRGDDGLAFLMPLPEERLGKLSSSAAAADGGSAALRVEEAAAARQRDASMYRAKARGRMFGSPSGAQRTYHEGAHVATSMGIAGAGIMACFEMDKAVHEREPPTERCDANTHTHTHALIRTWATHSWVQTG
jgi:hypothetical protein